MLGVIEREQERTQAADFSTLIRWACWDGKRSGSGGLGNQLLYFQIVRALNCGGSARVAVNAASEGSRSSERPRRGGRRSHSMEHVFTSSHQSSTESSHVAVRVQIYSLLKNCLGSYIKLLEWKQEAVEFHLEDNAAQMVIITFVFSSTFTLYL